MNSKPESIEQHDINFVIREQLLKPAVLFVDDEPGVTGAITRLFRKSSYQIMTANSAEQALLLLNDKLFNVIVSDQRMPGMSGERFLHEAHFIQPQAIKLMYCGNADLVADNQCQRNYPISRFILKPCFDDELVGYINEAVSSSRTEN